MSFLILALIEFEVSDQYTNQLIVKWIFLCIDFLDMRTKWMISMLKKTWFPNQSYIFSADLKLELIFTYKQV
jgi:hypothetical protein